MRGTLLPIRAVALTALVALAATAFFYLGQGSPWSAEERQRIASLSLGALPPLPPDPSNAVADMPAAAALGKALFFDTRLSANGQVACATCHLPDKQFQDGKPLAQGIGTTARRTMPIAGTAYSPWLFWDGRTDSQWAQALGPLESPVEHGSNRADIVATVARHYAEAYADVFGVAPGDTSVDRAFSNVGKAIAAFERTVMPAASRFDRYADAVAAGKPSKALSPAQIEGLRLFIGKASCINCHNGPLFTDNDFHNTGVASVPALPDDIGRMDGASQVRQNPFNCLGEFSDAAPAECAELAFMKTEGEELVRAFKTPSLRDVAGRAPYMHAGQVASLAEAVAHYNAAPAAPAGHSELRHLDLTAEEQANLIAFLESLTPIE